MSASAALRKENWAVGKLAAHGQGELGTGIVGRGGRGGLRCDLVRCGVVGEAVMVGSGTALRGLAVLVCLGTVRRGTARRGGSVMV